MPSLIKFSLSALLLVPGLSNSAEALDLSALLKLASARSESGKIAEEGLNAARARKSQALGEWLPRLSLKAGENFSDLGNREFQSPYAKLNLRQELLSGLDQPAALQAGDAYEASAKAQIRATALNLESELGNAYFQVLQKEEELEAEKAVLKLAQDSAKELESRVRLGRNRKAELSSSLAQVARIQALLASIEGERLDAREELSSLSGVSLDQPLAATPELPAAAAEPALMKASLNSLPNLEVLRHDLAVAEAAELAAGGAFLPTLFAEGNWNFARQGGVTGNDWDAAIGLDLPLFRGGALWARKKAATAATAQARLRLERAQRESARELRQAWQGLQSSLSKAEATRVALEAAEQSYKDQTRDFNNSLVTSLDLLNAFQAVENTRLDSLRARYDAHRAALRLRLASGTPLN